MLVHIENFQSIEDLSLEVKGFTVIVGKSNLGKSAVIRAIDGVLTNLAGQYFVRHGAKHAQVTLSYQGHEIVWSKGSGLNQYQVNGETLDGVGRNSPELLKVLGFKPLTLSRQSMSVQVATQFDPLFLVGQEGSVVAEALSDVDRVHVLQAAQKEVDKDRRQNRSKSKIREEDLSNVKQEIQDLQLHQQTVRPLYQRLQDSVAQTQAMQTRRDRLVQLISRIEQLTQDCELALSRASLAPLPAIQKPNFQALLALIARWESLEGIQAPPPPPSLSDLQPPPLAAMRALEKRWEALALELPPPEVTLPSLTADPFFKAQSTRETLRQVISQCRTAETSLAAATKQLEEAEAEWRSVQEALGECPLCHKPFGDSLHV